MISFRTFSFIIPYEKHVTAYRKTKELIQKQTAWKLSGDWFY